MLRNSCRKCLLGCPKIRLCQNMSAPLSAGTWGNKPFPSAPHLVFQLLTGCWKVSTGIAPGESLVVLCGVSPAVFWGAPAEQSPHPNSQVTFTRFAAISEPPSLSSWVQSWVWPICRKKKRTTLKPFFPNCSILEVYVVITYSAVSHRESGLRKMYLP